MSATAAAADPTPTPRFPPSSKFCVTGATGFVAQHIIRVLLSHDHSVVGTVRPSTLGSAEKMEPLKELQRAHPGRLEFVASELLTANSFDGAVEGCVGVFHTASPFVIETENAEEDLLRPAVEGTLNVLSSAAGASTVERVVLTSSMAAMTDSPVNGHVYSEADWNTASSATSMPYYASKTLAERAAWEFVGVVPEESEMESARNTEPFELVTINPIAVVGRQDGARINESIDFLRQLIDGEVPAIVDMALNFVDVRDVAEAHVAAMERAEAHGRYLLGTRSWSISQLVDLFGAKYPGHPHLPTRSLAGTCGSLLVRLSSYFQPRAIGQTIRHYLGRSAIIDSSKAQADLGLSFFPPEASLLNAVESLRVQSKLSHPIAHVVDNAEALEAVGLPLPPPSAWDEHENLPQSSYTTLHAT